MAWHNVINSPLFDFSWQLRLLERKTALAEIQSYNVTKRHILSFVYLSNLISKEKSLAKEGIV